MPPICGTIAAAGGAFRAGDDALGMRGRQPGADDVDICAVVKPCPSMIDSVRPYSRRVSVKNVRVAVLRASD